MGGGETGQNCKLKRQTQIYSSLRFLRVCARLMLNSKTNYIYILIAALNQFSNRFLKKFNLLITAPKQFSIRFLISITCS